MDSTILKTRKPPGPTGVPIEAILERWNAGETMAQIAEHYGVTRQAVSFRLIRAGYSPAERRAAVRDEAADTGDAYREQRLETISRRVEARERARDNLKALAAEQFVTPYTLAQWAMSYGAYKRRAEQVESHRSDTHLPARASKAGKALAARVVEVCAPWNPAHIARLIRMPLDMPPGQAFEGLKGTGAPKKG